MGQVKQALLELEDFVCNCLRDEDLVENKYYQFKGAE